MKEMKEEQIAQLLQRYMEADTTAEEERLLRSYFERGDYPLRFAAYAEMFCVTAQEFPVLTDAEADGLLQLCPAAPVRPKRYIWHAVRYAAVWLFGLLLGGGAVAWLSRSDNGVSSAAPETAQMAMRVDTLIRERVIVQSDTVYMVKYKTIPADGPAQAANGRRDVAAGASHPVSPDKNAENRLPVQDASWDNFTNRADLAER